MGVPSACQRLNKSIFVSIALLAVLFCLSLGFYLLIYSLPFNDAKTYIPATCILINASVATIPGPPSSFYCLRTKYLAVWQSIDDYTILASPISASTSLAYSESELNNYPLNTALDCLCTQNPTIIMASQYPNFQTRAPCNFYAMCFLNVEIVKFVSSQNAIIIPSYMLIGFGSVGLLYLLLISFILCYYKGCCHGRCRKRQEYNELDIRRADKVDPYVPPE